MGKEDSVGTSNTSLHNTACATARVVDARDAGACGRDAVDIISSHDETALVKADGAAQDKDGGAAQSKAAESALGQTSGIALVKDDEAAQDNTDGTAIAGSNMQPGDATTDSGHMAESHTGEKDGGSESTRDLNAARTTRHRDGGAKKGSMDSVTAATSNLELRTSHYADVDTISCKPELSPQATPTLQGDGAAPEDCSSGSISACSASEETGNIGWASFDQPCTSPCTSPHAAGAPATRSAPACTFRGKGSSESSCTCFNDAVCSSWAEGTPPAARGGLPGQAEQSGLVGRHSCSSDSREILTFGPYKGGGLHEGRDGLTHNPASSDGKAMVAVEGTSLVVQVSTPAKVSGQSTMFGGVEYYMSYPLSTTTTMGAYDSAELSVQRRFSDFVTLADILQGFFPGCILPPRPKRNVVEGRRMAPEFIETRRIALQRYLNRLGVHPIIGKSTALQLFLEHMGELRHSPAWMRMSTRSKSDAEKAHSLVAAPPPPDSKIPEEETSLRLQSAHIDNVVKGRLQVVADFTLKWIQDSNMKCNIFQDLHLALKTLSDYERSHSSECPADELTQAVNAVDKLSSGCLQASEILPSIYADADRMSINVSDHLDYIPSIQAAFKHRETALSSFIAAETELNSRCSAIQNELYQEGEAHDEVVHSEKRIQHVFRAVSEEIP
eukprot:gene22012-29070_t